MICRDLYKQILAISVVIFLAVVSLSGCTDTKNTDNSLNTKFIGTWTGTLKISTFGPIGGNNTTVTKLTFMQDTVAATLNNERWTNTMNYTYAINGDNLVLKPSFSGRGMTQDRQSFNGTRPPFNNGTMPPFNHTKQYNGTWPPNGQPSGDSQRQSMSLSFVYSFDENYTVLYLNNTKFTKIS